MGTIAIAIFLVLLVGGVIVYLVRQRGHSCSGCSGCSAEGCPHETEKNKA